VTATTHDFDLHGIVGVRLLDARATDVAKVERQLGPISHPLEREPDIAIRFVEQLAERPVTYVGVGDTGFNRDGFFLLRGKAGVPGRAAIPFDEVGGRITVTCERHLPAVPHLLALVNLTALAKGVLPLHASAFTMDGIGVLVTGWSKGGKTETLLAAMDGGAQYVGDEWLYLTPDGGMLGLPEPIRLWSWHFEQQPRLLRQRPRSERRRLRVWTTLGRLGRAPARSRGRIAGVLRRAAPIVQRQAYLQVPPTELFGEDRVVLRARLDAVVLVLSHSSRDITSETIPGAEVAARMLASLAEERAAFMTDYRQYRFAFPAERQTFVDGASHREAELLRTLFDGRSVARVAHPYPCDITALGQAVLSQARAHAPVRRNGELVAR
jgi:hypothetical protein